MFGACVPARRGTFVVGPRFWVLGIHVGTCVHRVHTFDIQALSRASLYNAQPLCLMLVLWTESKGSICCGARSTPKLPRGRSLSALLLE